LQIRGGLIIIFPSIGSYRGVQIQQINLDDWWSGFPGLRRNMPGDLAYDSGRRESDSGRRIAQHRINTLIADAT
jgi:hypothetical protein